MADSRFTGHAVALAALLLAASPAAAAEAVLRAPGAPGPVVSALETAALSLQTARDDGATAQDILAAARADYGRLVGALYARGYYAPVVTIRLDGREAAGIAPLSVPDRVGRVDIRVETGPRFSFSEARIGPLAPGTELPEDFAPGNRARLSAIRGAATAGVSGWRDAGHAKARVAGQDLTADHRSATLAARIALAPGPYVRFGNLVIEGESRVRPERLRKIAGLPSGEPFDPEAVEQSAERLRRTGVFRSVRLAETDTLRPGNTMDIALSVSDEKKRRLGFGAEFSSLEGLALSGFWLHRNLLRGAERLRFDAGISGIGGTDSGGEDYTLSARFDRPAVLDPDTGIYALAAIERLDEPDSVEETGRFGVGLTHVFSDRLSGEAALVFRYSDVSDDLGERSMTHAMLPASLTWDGRDDPLDPRAGTYLATTLTPMFGLSGDADSGARLTADARAYRAVSERVVLAGRVQFGSIMGANAKGVPPAMLFFSGGGGTVRGQPYESLAVELGGGDRIGGRSFLGLSAEARVEVRGPFSLVAFADAGFIGPESWVGGDGEWHSGAGLGLRYATGIGPIRVDIAAPTSGDTGDGVEIYIGIGQAF
ncbi:autotransporter secretion outer membrane protein TamA [Rhodovulum sp. ES.010]|uniref:autotransporter assembly complex protein TamA n=1 Tax=Rhodovulum sp. ES.010 TaxID=1882821 RepID=UPI00092A2E9C|nr:autotransporter assembly complex family protein [Rhodovulum sp. ES.010]SIO23274.1 autotransporter secretion outer membrane protein TamA [Rhodovulum sp. ES.010]